MQTQTKRHLEPGDKPERNSNKIQSVSLKKAFGNVCKISVP